MRDRDESARTLISGWKASNLAVIATYALQERGLPYRVATHTVTSIMQVDAIGDDFSRAEQMSCGRN